MRIMLDTNILISIIFFPSGVTREFTRQVGLGNRIVLCDYVIEELRLVVDVGGGVAHTCGKGQQGYANPCHCHFGKY